MAKGLFDKDNWPVVERGLREIADRDKLIFEEVVIRALHSGKNVPPVRSNDCPGTGFWGMTWPSIRVDHLTGCAFCQTLVKQAFPVLILEPGSDALREHEMARNEQDVRETCPNFRTWTRIGSQTWVFLPMRNQSEHIEKCLYCRLIVQQFSMARHRIFLEDDSPYSSCPGAKGWQVYPVYAPEDQATIINMIGGCKFGHCSAYAPLRFEFNALRDKPLFQKLQRYPVAVLRFKQLVRTRFKKRIGDFISSWRFHSDPFCRRHPWAIWNDEDRMLKLLLKQRLSYPEHLYRSVLADEMWMDDALQCLRSTLPKAGSGWEYSVPKHGLQLERFKLAEYIRLDTKSRRLGISTKAVREQEAQELEELTDRVEKEMAAEEAVED